MSTIDTSLRLCVAGNNDRARHEYSKYEFSVENYAETTARRAIYESILAEIDISLRLRGTGNDDTNLLSCRNSQARSMPKRLPELLSHIYCLI